MLSQPDRYAHELRHFVEATLPNGFKYELSRRVSDLHQAMRALREDGTVSVRYDAFDMINRIVGTKIVLLRTFCRQQQWAIPADTIDAYQELAVQIGKHAHTMYADPTDDEWVKLIDMTVGLRELVVFTAAMAYRQKAAA